MRNDIKLNGLLIAAGKSGRMGKFKPLLTYQSLPFSVGIVIKMLSVCDKVGIIIGYKGEELKNKILEHLTNPESVQLNEDVIDINRSPLVTRVNFITNADYKNGMFTSLQCGIKHFKNADWVLYHFVDQPDLLLSFYEELVSNIDNKYDWIQPRYNHQNGHPILIKNSLFKLIIDAECKSNLKSISTNGLVKKKYWNCNHPQILTDLDKPEDLDRLYLAKVHGVMEC